MAERNIGRLMQGWLRAEAETADLVMWAACFFLSLAQWHHVAYFFSNDFYRSVQAEQGILTGYPHWRFFQSRVLGPWLEKALSVIFGFNLGVAHIIVAIVMLTLCGAVMFYAGRAIGGRQSGWSALLAFHILFALMMARPWLYIWDYFVLLAAAVFMLLMVRRAPWWSFLLLMSVAFFNHESALFIGVWMVAKALTDAWAERRHPDWWLLGSGALGSLGGQLLIEFLRHALLNREIGWELFNDVGKRPTGQLNNYFHVQFTTNLHDIFQWIIHPDANLLFVQVLPLVLALVLAVMLVVRHGVGGVPLAIYAVTQFVALLLLAYIPETRTLLQLVPFLCLGGMLVANADWLKSERAGAGEQSVPPNLRADMREPALDKLEARRPQVSRIDTDPRRRIDVARMKP